MKKCPSCGSISPDDETECGVCGRDLWSVLPMTQTLEQAEIEDESKRRLEERSEARQVRKKATLKMLVGATVGFAILISGVVLVIFGSLWGVLLLPMGLFVLASATLGGLGTGVPRTWRERRVIKEDEDRERTEKEAASG